MRIWPCSTGHNGPAVEACRASAVAHGYSRDTRTPVSVVFDNLEVGASLSEIMEWFHLSREQIVAVIEFARRSLDPTPVHDGQVVDAHTFR